jgi:hypothetical protein
MPAVLVDSNVLLDVMTQDLRWFSWSAAAIEQAADSFRLVINQVIYADKLPFSQANRFWPIDGGVEPSCRRFRISSLAPMRPLPGTG